jgi:hypothetical protein
LLNAPGKDIVDDPREEAARGAAPFLVPAGQFNRLLILNQLIDC